MDIQSFILGMGAMLVVALVIGSVFPVVKVIKFGKEFREVQIWTTHEFENVKKDIEKREQRLYRRTDDIEKMIDSRCDKLYDKILKDVSPNKAFLRTISIPPKKLESESVDYDPLKGAKRIMDKLDNNK